MTIDDLLARGRHALGERYRRQGTEVYGISSTYVILEGDHDTHPTLCREYVIATRRSLIIITAEGRKVALLSEHGEFLPERWGAE